MGVVEEDFAIASQGIDAFLDAGSAGVVDTDARDLHIHSQIHHLGDFAGMRQAERTSSHREILCIHTHGSSLDGTDTRHDTIGGHLLLVHAEVVALVFYKQPQFLE